MRGGVQSLFQKPRGRNKDGRPFLFCYVHDKFSKMLILHSRNSQAKNTHKTSIDIGVTDSISDRISP